MSSPAAAVRPRPPDPRPSFLAHPLLDQLPSSSAAMTRARLTAPTPLKLVPLGNGVKPPRFPTFTLPSPPKPSFTTVRSRHLSGGSGVVVGELPKLVVS
ncbi:hypothetical protein JCM8208_004702 [Rhodotorula glutinis]